MVQLAEQTVRTIYTEAATAVDNEERKAIAKWARSSESEQRIRAMLKLAESDPAIATVPEMFDTDSWLLNCLNGTVTLRTGKLRRHRRKDLITKLAPLEFQHYADCPTWLAFLERVMGSNENLIRFLQRAVGYSLTGDTREQVLFFLYGTGANGKSTFLETIRAGLGDYAQQTPTETLINKHGRDIPNDLARLQAARFVSAVEIEDGRRLAESLVKQVTGGDMITARFLHAEWFEFRPQFKLFMAANHKPAVHGTDDAIWRRIRLIPFKVQIPEPERDPKLPEKLRQELPGILRWAVEGCLEWQRDGLGMPIEVKVATDSYRSEMDVMAAFLDECIIADHAKVSARDLYNSYQKWAGETGECAMSQRAFGMRLTERGFERVRGTGGRYWWFGIGLPDSE